MSVYPRTLVGTLRHSNGRDILKARPSLRSDCSPSIGTVFTFAGIRNWDEQWPGQSSGKTRSGIVSIHEGRQGSEGERRASGARQAPESCQAARAKDATDGSAGAGSATGCAVGGRLSSSRRAASMRHGSHGPKSAGGCRPFRAQASR